MKRLLTVVLILAVASIGLILGCAKEQKKIKIGAILPLTGSAAPYGQNAQRGILLALEEINAKGGIKGKKVEVIFEDSKTDPKEAVSALQKLYRINNIPFIIGDINSTGVLAMAPIAEKNHIILFSPGASNPKISDAGEYIFRNWHSDALEGEVDANFAYNRLGWKKTAVLYVNAAYGAGLAEVFRDTFKKLGGEIVAFEAYEQDAIDMRGQINRILSQNPDGIFLPGWPKEMSVALKQLKELGSKLPILSVQGFDDPSILKLAGIAAEGVIFSIPESPDPNDEMVKHFNVAYKQKFNMEPGVCSAAGYDALKIFMWAIEKAGYFPEKVQKEMAQLKDFPGADGKITFDERGDLLKPFSFKVVQQGKFTLYSSGGD
jgi:branched-chain amino acid transport system substrate-binding protein